MSLNDVKSLTSAWFIRSLVVSLDEDATHALVRALVHSRLDYCNGVLTGLSIDRLRRLQSSCSAASRWSGTSTRWRLCSSEERRHPPESYLSRRSSIVVCRQRTAGTGFRPEPRSVVKTRTSRTKVVLTPNPAARRRRETCLATHFHQSWQTDSCWWDNFLPIYGRSQWCRNMSRVYQVE